MSQITVCDACNQPLPKGLDKGLQLRMEVSDEQHLVLLVLPAGGANICPTCIATKVRVPIVDGPEESGTFHPERITGDVMNDVLAPLIAPVIDQAREQWQAEQNRAAAMRPQPQRAWAEEEDMYGPPQRRPQLRPQPLRPVPDMGAYAEAAGFNPMAPTEEDLAMMSMMRQRQAAAQRQGMVQPMDDEWEGPVGPAAYAQVAHRQPQYRRRPDGPPPLSMLAPE